MIIDFQHHKIEIKPESLSSFKKSVLNILSFYFPDNRCVLITDDKIWNIWGKEIFIEDTRFIVIKIPLKEKAKEISEVIRIFKELLRKEFKRDEVIITMGGGTISDTGGFIASTFLRGVKLVHIPTTFLAMIDAAIGGKTGVNLENAKNIIGTFYHPNVIIINPLFCSTLPQREYIATFGEVIKYAILKKENALLKLLETGKSKELQRDFYDMSVIIEECINIKMEYVRNDVYDTKGKRLYLNLGHTFGHAFESTSGFNILHGEAVGLGILCSIKLGELLYKKSKGVFRRVFIWMDKVGLFEHIKKIDMKINELLNGIDRFIRFDKKFLSSHRRFIVVKDIGRVEVFEDPPMDMIKKSIEETYKVVFR